MYKQMKFLAVSSHIFLFKMFISDYEESFGGQFWYLSTLFQFYFIFLLLCKLREKCVNRKRFILIGIVISAVWWCIVAAMGFEDIRVWNSFCLQYIWEFMLGMAVAEFLQEGKSIKISYNVLSITVIFYLFPFENIYEEIVVGISAFFISIIVAVIYGKLIKKYKNYISFHM